MILTYPFIDIIAIIGITNKTCGICAGSWLYPGAGAGFLSHTVHSFHLYVLYRNSSAYRREGLRSAQSPREGNSAGTDAVQKSCQPGTCTGGAEDRGKNGSGGIWKAVPVKTGKKPDRRRKSEEQPETTGQEENHPQYTQEKTK